jgi:hypothetical protein
MELGNAAKEDGQVLAPPACVMPRACGALTMRNLGSALTIPRF